MSSPSFQSGRLRIAVAGASGRVGTALVASLSGDSVDVVALTRDPTNRRLPAGIETAAVDFDIPSTRSEALVGIDRLFISHGTSDRQVANEIAIIDAVVAVGVPHIVKLLAMGPPTRLHPFDWHMKIEAHLAAQDIGFTALRLRRAWCDRPSHCRSSRAGLSRRGGRAKRRRAPERRPMKAGPLRGYSQSRSSASGRAEAIGLRVRFPYNFRTKRGQSS